MDFDALLEEIRASPDYRGQIVHVHKVLPRNAEFSPTLKPLSPACRAFLESEGIEQLYSHQARSVDLLREGRDVLVVTGTASGKSLCYQLPLLEMLESDPDGRAVLLHPTKALSQDQCRAMSRAVRSSGLSERKASSLLGVYDGDTPGAMRRKLRDEAHLIFTNPDMVHAALLPQHPRWADFLRRLRYVIVDEMHTYSGIFGSNAANLFRRLRRVCAHYGSDPLYVLCSATVGNPLEVATKLICREPELIDNDGSPRGKKTFVFWNPPIIRRRRFRSRRSANVEATELMTQLIASQVPTITFSKAKVTSELIYRYASEMLAPHLRDKVTPYRGGYLPAERREIERKLFDGELLGVSTTRALELGIDVGGLDAAIVVGYPGTLAGFFQQAGRAGRRDRESLAVLVGVDTAVNQYVMKHPDYVFGRPIERIVLDPGNPYVLSGQLRCAAYELPLSEAEVGQYGPYARLVLDVLVEQRKLNKVGDKWYHASDDVPEHEVSLRDYCDANVTITDVECGQVIGEMNKFDAQSIIHPEAIYLHQGDTYLVLSLDLVRNLCLVRRIDCDYYTQPHGGTDVHHIDQPLRERQFGGAAAYFGEVTAYFRTQEYERIHFYSLDAVSRHPIDMPTYQLETMALWITPSEELVRKLIAEGIDVHRGLMGIGYATRMILPLFIKCETLDFSHSSCTAINAPWHTVFVYERYPHGLGFTEEAYDMLADVILAVDDRVRSCECGNGCPSCIGKPLRGYTCWNIERGEANIPSKKATLRLLRGIIQDGASLRKPDAGSFGQPDAERMLLLERGIRRRLERLADPELFHPIDPRPAVGFPAPEQAAASTTSDVTRRAIKRIWLDKAARSTGIQPPSGDTSRITREEPSEVDSELAHETRGPRHREQSRALRNLLRSNPTAKPSQPAEPVPGEQQVQLGDRVAARALRMRKKK